MKRHLRILDHAVATLWLNPLKTLVVLAVYSMLVAVLLSLVLYVDAHKREAASLLAVSPEIIVQQLRGGRHELVPVALGNEIRGIRGVGEVTPRVWGYSYDPPTRATFTLWGADSVPHEALEPSPGELDEERGGGRCFVGRGLAELRFLGPGDRLPIKTADGDLLAPVVEGIFTSESAILTNDLVVMPTSMVRRILGIPNDRATDIAVWVHNPNEVDTVVQKITTMRPDIRSVTRKQMLATYVAVFDWRAGIWLVVLMGSVAAFAILVWDRATGLSSEEYRNVGLLKAVGWKKGEVLELKALEGAVISVVAFLAGAILAEIHLLVFGGALFAGVVKGWSVLKPPFDVAPKLAPVSMLLWLAFAVLPYVAASLIPAWRAAVTDPDGVMRS